MTTSEELFGDEHVRRYIETNGEVGYDWRNGTKILILFTKGRKSGEERANAIVRKALAGQYRKYGERWWRARRTKMTRRPVPTRRAKRRATKSRPRPTRAT